MEELVIGVGEIGVLRKAKRAKGETGKGEKGENIHHKRVSALASLSLQERKESSQVTPRGGAESDFVTRQPLIRIRSCPPRSLDRGKLGEAKHLGGQRISKARRIRSFSPEPRKTKTRVLGKNRGPRECSHGEKRGKTRR